MKRSRALFAKLLFVIPAETRRLLRNRNFLHLWANHAFQQVAYNTVNFGLMIWVFELTRINFAVSLWILAFLIPSVSLSIPAGILADNYNRKKIMIATDLLWGLTVLGFALARNSFPLILLLTFVAQGIDEFFLPSQSATLPRLVGDDELLPANSLFALTITAAVVAGFFLAGPLLRFFGYFAPFGLAAGLVFLGALSISFLPSVKATRRRVRPSISLLSHFRRELRGELAILARERAVFTTGLFMAMLYGGMGAAGAVAPGFMEQGLGIDARDISFVGVIPGVVGFILGTVLIGKFGNRWKARKMVKAGLFVFGLALVLLASVPALRLRFAAKIGYSLSALMDYSSRRFGRKVPIPFEHLAGYSLLIATLAFVLATALAFISVPTTTKLQRITPDVARGRTFGAFSMLTSLLTASFVISAGLAADLFGPAPLVALVGMAAIFLAFFRERVFGWVFGVVSNKIRNSKHEIRNKFK